MHGSTTVSVVVCSAATLFLLSLMCMEAQAVEPIVIRFSHVVSADSPKGKAVERFKDGAERRTNGRVKIEIYPNASLFKDEHEIAAVRAGNVEMVAPAHSDLGGDLDIPEFNVFCLPYLFLGKDMVRRITDSVGQDIFRKLEPKGLFGLAYWDAGFKIFAANTSIKRPQDLKGLRMRMSAKIYEPMLLALNTKPIEMGFGATVKALQEGKIDGNENTPANLYTRKLHELQKHMVVTNHVYLGYAVIANKKFWDNLPADIKTQLRLAMIDATRYANLYAEQQNEHALTSIKASGKTEIHSLSIDELSTWRKALEPTHRAFEANPQGKQLLQAIYKEGKSLGYHF